MVDGVNEPLAKANEIIMSNSQPSYKKTERLAKVWRWFE